MSTIIKKIANMIRPKVYDVNQMKLDAYIAAHNAAELAKVRINTL